MRHINLNNILSQIFASDLGAKAKTRLWRAHKKAAGMSHEDRKLHTKRNGPNKWKPIKDFAVDIAGHKCWYTEAELIGAPLVVDHFRPVCNYWWLAYAPENYRISCPWANSHFQNPLYGCAGGKGDHFPLLYPAARAKGKNKLRFEKPIILDPCNADDCELLAFQIDGRPVLNPAHIGNDIAERRVEESNILLNLDHPEFNSKREQLCIDIGEDVDTYETLPEDSQARTTIHNRLAARLAPTAPFSTAARFYLQIHRHLNWVQSILDDA